MDLLTGRVDKHHPLYPWLKGYGLSEVDLDWFRTHPQAPDVLGLDYYPHSDWHGHSYTDRNSNTYSYDDSDAHANSYAHAQSNAHTKNKSDPEESTDSAAAPVAFAS